MPIETKYNRREPRLHQDKPEPLAMIYRIADTEGHPLYAFANSLLKGDRKVPIEQVTQDTGQELDQVRKTVTLLAGVFGIEMTNGKEIVVIPETSTKLPPLS